MTVGNKSSHSTITNVVLVAKCCLRLPLLKSYQYDAYFNVDLVHDKSIGILLRILVSTNIVEFNDDNKQCIQFSIFCNVDNF
jgi:hypothetical protein